MFLFLYLCIFIFSVLYQTRSSKNDWRNVCIYIKNHVERRERGEININKSRNKNGNQSEVYKRVLNRQRPIFYKTNSNRERNFMLKELRFPFESPFSKSPAENNVNKTRSAQEEKNLYVFITKWFCEWDTKRHKVRFIYMQQKKWLTLFFFNSSSCSDSDTSLLYNFCFIKRIACTFLFTFLCCRFNLSISQPELWRIPESVLAFSLSFALFLRGINDQFMIPFFWLFVTQVQ